MWAHPAGEFLRLSIPEHDDQPASVKDALVPVHDLKNRLDGEFRWNLRRCPVLSDAEVRFLALLATYQHGSKLLYNELCGFTGWSRSKLQRTINSLVDRGLVVRTHRAFKKTTLKIASAAVQADFAKAHSVSPMTHDQCVTHEPTVCHPRHHSVSPMTQPMLKRDLKRNLKTSCEAQKGGEGVPQEPGDVAKLLQQTLRAMRRPGSD